MPFTVVDTGFDWRGVLHRIMAVIFSVLGIYHVIYLGATKRGREQLKALWPGMNDFADMVETIRYNAGLSKTKPRHARYTYVEKAEYWALIWGSLIMVLTGTFLVFENFAMKYFPKWATDVAMTIHFYEAVLATLAIIVWHFYFTIFDPEHYPMNWSMMTGKTGEKHGHDDEKNA